MHTILNDQGIFTQEEFGDPNKTVVCSVYSLPSTSISVESQLPEFVRTDHPKFVNFLKAYYDWMDIKENTSYEAKRIKQYGDIDTTRDEFEEALHRQFLIHIPRTILTNKTQLLKNIRDFYRAKGTEKSFKFFFRTLYNSPTEFYYPRKDVLRISDGKYIRQKSFRIEMISGNPATIQNNIVYGTDNPTSVYIDKCRTIVTEHATYYELFINTSSLTGNFNMNELVHGKDTKQNVLYTARIVPVLSNIELIIDNTTAELKSGSGYQYNDTFLVENDTGTLGKVRVSSIDSKGSIKKLSIKDFGVKYSSQPFLADLTPTNSTPATKFSMAASSFSFDIRVETSSVVLTISNFRDISEVSNAESMFTTGSSIRLVSKSAQKTYQIYRSYNFYNKKIVLYLTSENIFLAQDFIDEITHIESVSGSGATVKITPGVFCEYEGYFISNNGQLSETKYLHDGEFYQQFSYVVYSKESAETYRTYLKDMVHPIGLKFYGGFRDPTTVDGKSETPPHAPVKRTFQQYPRHHLFFDVPVPSFALSKNGIIQKENKDFSILPKGAAYNPFYFSIRIFDAVQSTDVFDVLFNTRDGQITVRPLQTTENVQTYFIPYELPIRRYEDLLFPIELDRKTPVLQKPNHTEKFPALDAVKNTSTRQIQKISSQRSSHVRPFGASFGSIFRDRFRYHPNTNMSFDENTIVNDGTYWGDLSSPALQYANTQIQHFKHMIPKALELGDVPDILIVKNGKILQDNLDYIIVGKNNNPWNPGQFYCIKLINSSELPQTSDKFEVIFRDNESQKVFTKVLTHVSGNNIIQIPHNVSLLRPESRINIMPESIVTRGI